MKHVIILAVLFSAALRISAQKSEPRIQQKLRDPLDSFCKAKLGVTITLKGKYTSIDDKSIDFSHLLRPAFICFGMYGCHPCEHELPVFVSQAAAHPEVDFVYITYDAESTRLREFAEVGLQDLMPAGNYYILHMDETAMRYGGLVLGFPTKYFVDANGIIRYTSIGGNPLEPAQKIIDRITRIINGGGDEE